MLLDELKFLLVIYKVFYIYLSLSNDYGDDDYSWDKIILWEFFWIKWVEGATGADSSSQRVIGDAESIRKN